MHDRYHGVEAAAPHVIGERDITSRSAATLGLEIARPLQRADLTRPLWYFGFDARVLSVSDYPVPNPWSLSIHDNHRNLDGIYFRSRFTNAPPWQSLAIARGWYPEAIRFPCTGAPIFQVFLSGLRSALRIRAATTDGISSTDLLRQRDALWSDFDSRCRAASYRLLFWPVIYSR